MTVRIGFLGAGFISSYHASMLKTSGADFQFVAVFDPDADKLAQFSNRFDVEVVVSESEVLDGVDAVYVCTWTSEHRRLVESVAARGLAVFCEKPLATNAADAFEMVAAVARARVINQVGLVLRDSPSFNLLRHLIRQPENGRVMNVIFRDDQFIPTQGFYESTWRGDSGKAGSGTLLEHSIHDLDLLEWLCGPATSVSGHSREFHALAGIEDVAVATLEFESGALATLTSVWHDVLARPSMRRVEVFCEDAHYVLDGDAFGPVSWTRNDGDVGSVEGKPLVDALRAAGIELRNPDGAFVEAVISGSPAYPSFAEALRAHVLADAFYESAANGGKPGRGGP